MTKMLKCRDCGRDIYEIWAYFDSRCGECYCKAFPTCHHAPICTTIQACAKKAISRDVLAQGERDAAVATAAAQEARQ